MAANFTAAYELDYLLKISIIGDSRTALLQRCTKDYFSTDYAETDSVDFQLHTINVDTKYCKLQIWDTARQDRFKSVVPIFYRGALGIIICFDITDLESFRNVNNWLEEVQRYCRDGIPIILVGTKSDLQSQRMVPDTTIKAYVEQKDLSYVEISSKTNENIEHCFTILTRAIIKHLDQLESCRKDTGIQKPSVDLNLKTEPVGSGGWMGGNKCNI